MPSPQGTRRRLWVYTVRQHMALPGSQLTEWFQLPCRTTVHCLAANQRAGDTPVAPAHLVSQSDPPAADNTRHYWVRTYYSLSFNVRLTPVQYLNISHRLNKVFYFKSYSIHRDQAEFPRWESSGIVVVEYFQTSCHSCRQQQSINNNIPTRSTVLNKSQRSNKNILEVESSIYVVTVTGKLIKRKAAIRGKLVTLINCRTVTLADTLWLGTVDWRGDVTLGPSQTFHSIKIIGNYSGFHVLFS